jgi:hypothetical protein
VKKFIEILATLENADYLQRLELADADGNIERIENKPGTQGSLKVYHHLWKKHGAINAAAAKEGLALYAEHTEDAQNNPGKHPNIDRLFEVLGNGLKYEVTAI